MRIDLRTNLFFLAVLLVAQCSPLAAVEPSYSEFSADAGRPSFALVTSAVTPKDGPGTPRATRAYRFVSCGKFKDNEVWITDESAGWVPMENLIPLSKAPEYLSKKLDNGSDDPEVFASFIHAYVKLAEREKACAALDRVPEAMRDDMPIRYARAMVNALLTFDSDAVHDDLVSLAQAKQFDEYWFSWLMLTLARSNYTATDLESIQALEAGKLANSSGIHAVAKSLLQFSEGNFDSAVTAIRPTRRSNTFFHMAYQVESMALSSLGRIAEEESVLNRAITIWPKDDHNYYLRGMYYFRDGDRKNAERDLRMAVSLKTTGDPRSPLALAKVILSIENDRGIPDKKRVKEACEILKELSDGANQQNVEFELLYAIALNKLGEYDESLKAINRCEKLDPSLRLTLKPFRNEAERKLKESDE